MATRNDFGVGGNVAPKGTIKGVPYNFNLKPTASTKGYVVTDAGDKLDSR